MNVLNNILAILLWIWNYYKIKFKNSEYKVMKQFISFLKRLKSGLKRDEMRQDDIPPHFLKINFNNIFYLTKYF